MKKIIAIILCALMALPLMACGGHEEPAEPTPGPTMQPTETQKPDEVPTGDPLCYDFNKDTLEYSDEYVNFTLPEGFSVLKDTTSEYDGAYKRFMNFTNPDPAFQSNSVNYNAAAASSESENVHLSSFTQEDLEKLFKEQFEKAFQSEVEIKTVSFRFDTAGDCPAIIYEYTVSISGTELNQIVVMMEEGNMSLSVAYTFTEDDWEIYRASAETVMPAASEEK